MGKADGESISSVTDRLRHLSPEELRIIEEGINLMIEAFQIQDKS